MSEILSDDDIKAAVRPLYGNEIAFEMAWPDMVLPEARAVERAVVEKLAAMGEGLPEPTVHLPRFNRDSGGALPIYAYTADQLRTERAKGVVAGMAQERARCAAVCDGLAEDAGDDFPPYVAGWQEALEAAEQAISKDAMSEWVMVPSDADEAKEGGR